jgi:hypothetical protein
MPSNSPVPFFPTPPANYDRQYMSQLVRAFAVFAQQVNNPGDAIFTTLRLTNLPANDQGLPTGALFQHDGFVKITQANTPHVAGVSGTSVLGTVTVVIT